MKYGFDIVTHQLVEIEAQSIDEARNLIKQQLDPRAVVDIILVHETYYCEQTNSYKVEGESYDELGVDTTTSDDGTDSDNA